MQQCHVLQGYQPSWNPRWGSGIFAVGVYQGSPLRGQPFALGCIPVGEWEDFAARPTFRFELYPPWGMGGLRYAANPSLWAISPLGNGRTSLRGQPFALGCIPVGEWEDFAARPTLRFGLYPRWGMRGLRCVVNPSLRAVSPLGNERTSLRGELFALGFIPVGEWEDFAARRTLRSGLYPRWGMGGLRYAANPSLWAVSLLGNGRTSLRGEPFAPGCIPVGEWEDFATRRTLRSGLYPRWGIRVLGK
jgi:hypothetical protein